MEHTFKTHKLSDAERTWLDELMRTNSFDPRVAKVKLLDKIPEDFQPSQIDPRICSNGRLTPIGLWLLDPSSEFLKAIDHVIWTIREMIIESPGLDIIKAAQIAHRSGLSENVVGQALYELRQLGQFFSAAGSSSDTNSVDVIELKLDTSYDEYLNFKGLVELLERFYVTRGKLQTGTIPVIPNFGGLIPYHPFFTPSREIVETKPIKQNTAFVLMAMDPTNPERIAFIRRATQLESKSGHRTRRINLVGLNRWHDG